jgi:hypothetical protein
MAYIDFETFPDTRLIADQTGELYAQRISEGL